MIDFGLSKLALYIKGALATAPLRSMIKCKVNNTNKQMKGINEGRRITIIIAFPV